MNKGLTVVILLMVLSAMGSVMYAHLSSVTPPPPSPERPATPFSPPEGVPGPPLTNPLNAPQGDRGGLDRIAPPITSGQTPGAEGAPRPVNLTAGADGVPARPVEQPVPRTLPPRETARVEGPTTTATPPKGTAEQEQAPANLPPPVPQVREKPSDGSPGLTPWTPPATPQTPAPQIQTPQTPTPAQNSGQTTQRPETVQQPSGPQRGAVTDPIRPVPRTTAQGQTQGQTRTTQATPQKPVALSEKGAHTLKSIAFRFAGQNLELVIQADNAFPCKTFSLTGPDRLVIDLPGVWKGMQVPALPQNRLVKNVRLGQQAAGPRLVLDLTGPLKGHSVERDGATVTILLR